MSDRYVPCCSPNCKSPDRLIDLLDDSPLSYWEKGEVYSRPPGGKRPSGKPRGRDHKVFKGSGKYAHNACVDAEANGVSPGQGSLL